MTDNPNNGFAQLAETARKNLSLWLAVVTLVATGAVMIHRLSAVESAIEKISGLVNKIHIDVEVLKTRVKD